MAKSVIDVKRFRDITKQPIKHINSSKTQNLNKINILIRLYKKQRLLAELKTAQAIDNCQKLMVLEIEKFLNVKYNQIPKLMNKLSTSKIYPLVNYFNLITSREIQEITLMLEKILRRELENRFMIQSNASLKFDCHPDQLFGLIEAWRKSKQRTLFITQQVEKWGKNHLHKAIRINFPNNAFLYLEKKFELSSSLLKSLEINTQATKAEYLIDLRNRLEGTLDSLKTGLIIDTKEKVAQTYYQLHDLIIGRKFLEKIIFLENELAEEKRYLLIRQEA